MPAACACSCFTMLGMGAEYACLVATGDPVREQTMRRRQEARDSAT